MADVAEQGSSLSASVQAAADEDATALKSSSNGSRPLEAISSIPMIRRDSSRTTTPTRAAGATGLSASRGGDGSGSPTVTQQQQQPTLRHDDDDGTDSPATVTFDRELESLALSSAITELGYSIQAAFTLIFEVQELRHAAVESASTERASSEAVEAGPPGTNDATSEVDGALMRLDSQLEATASEFNQLKERIQPLLAGSATETDFVQAKWAESLQQWQEAQDGAEEMRRELVEDKYLIVYRTVSKQAADMMTSLEKIFAQCHTFVHEVHSKHGSSQTANAPSRAAPPEDLQSSLTTFMSLHKSLHQKTKYYVPSCEHVLKTIDSGIAQQRSLNGEVLRGHQDMKQRWRNLQERLRRTEREMESVQEILSELSERVQEAASTASSASASRKSSVSTPGRGTLSGVRARSSGFLTPSPKSNKQSSPGQAPRTVSPFRKIANRLKSSGRGKEESPPPPVPVRGPRSQSPGSSNTSSSIASMQPRVSGQGQAGLSSTARQGSQHTPPGSSAGATLPRSTAMTNVSAIHHRYSQSTGQGALYTPPALSRGPSHISSAASERARSPLPGSRLSRPPTGSGMTTDVRPAWNSSVKVTHDDLNRSAGARKSLPFGTPSRAMSPSVGHSTGRMTLAYPATYSRPASRNFTAPPVNRSASPAFSANSNASASAARPRPSSPHTRIPAPLQIGAPSPSKQGRPSFGTGSNGALRKPSSSAPPFQDEDEHATETLFFRSAEPMGGALSASLTNRAISPTPSAGGYTVASSIGGTRSASRRQSHIPIPTLALSASSTHNTPLHSPAHGQESVFTPEPSLRSRAARASAIYGGGTGTPTSSRKSMGGLPAPPPIVLEGGRRPRTSVTSSAADTDARRSVAGTPSGDRRMSYFGRSASPFGLVGRNGAREEGQPYIANPVDPLDVEVASIINSQPCFVACERVDLPLSKAAAEAQTASERIARYSFGYSEKPLNCKLVDRGPGRGRKVMCRIGGGWQDLSLYLLDYQAQY